MLADVSLVNSITPGTPQEAAILLLAGRSALNGKTRVAEPGAYWTYRIVAPANSRLNIRYSLSGEATVTAVGFDGKPVAIRREVAEGQMTIFCTVPAKSPPGNGLNMKLTAKNGPVSVTGIRATILLPDKNGDGLPDMLEAAMGVNPNARPVNIQRPPRPYTTFQTGLPYSADIAVPTDAVLVYSANEETIRSWIDKGYLVQTMGGFRAGPEYVKDHPDEVQRDGTGNPITIGGSSFYMLPTEARNENSKQYYITALGAGSQAVCPEEPEIFAKEGYSEAFKREWRAKYGSDWESPHGSIEARYKAEQLKAFLTRRQIEAILLAAENEKPAAARMLAIHSPVTYYQWAITVPHFALFSIPTLQEIIGQVWTGTARSPTRLGGVRAERTFELGYLEYSSLNQLVRGSNKRLWFLMDPVEDDPGRTQEDYQRNYEQTLIASLLFPQVNSYEVMPWPQRIYGRTPPAYSTVVNTVVGALTEMWRFPDTTLDAGSNGIGTFVSDSMAWQREQPYPSDYDGFHALTLPLVSHGVPVDVLQLDRVTEPGYLNRVTTLLVSYDFLKPASPDINRAVAEWVRRGGCLLVVGGEDAYDRLKDSWWQKAGFASPLEALFTDLGLPVKKQVYSPVVAATAQLQTALTGDPAAHNLENRRQQSIDLTPFANETRSVFVRLEDVKPDDGWGAWLASAELRFGGRLAASFRTGSDIETRFLAEEAGSTFTGTARFADRNGYWVYRFDNLPRDRQVTLTLDIANGYLVKVGPARERAPLLETGDSGFDRTVQKVRLSPSYPPIFLQPNGQSTAIYRLPGAPSPVVWESKVGSGNVLYAGVPPAFFSATAQTSRWLRALVKRTTEKGLAAYREKPYFMIRRGPFKAVRALGADYRAEGRYVNLLSPTLAVVEDPEVPARNWAFWADAGTGSGPPKLLATSGRLRHRFEDGGTTSFVVQAPTGTEGAARLFSGRKSVGGARAFTLLGAELPVRTFPDGDTLLVRYPNDADGVVVRVSWK
jgi:hypothetical protein